MDARSRGAHGGHGELALRGLRAFWGSLAAVTLAIAPLAAQSDTLPRGRVIERVAADSVHAYALYLPAAWTAERRWPLLVLLDPGGRAVPALERFREAAERRGWVVMSSYDVRNGGADAIAANDRAVSAMLADAQRRLSIDLHRLYLGGFSGQARYAWRVGLGLEGRVAGVIGMGAGLPPPPALWLASLRQASPFPFFATVGTQDPNLREVMGLDSALDATAFPHRLARFEGGHDWPPPQVAARAVDWLEVQAMQAGLVPMDSAFVDAVFATELGRACGDAERRRVAAEFNRPLPRDARRPRRGC